MPRSHHWSLPSFALVALLVAACENPLAPDDVAGTYVLVAAMPPTVSGDTQLRMLADTLVIADDRTASRRISVEQVRLSTNDTTRYVELEMYTYRIRDSEIGLLTTCGIGALCEDLDGPSWYEVAAGRTELRPRGQSPAYYVKVAGQ